MRGSSSGSAARPGPSTAPPGPRRERPTGASGTPAPARRRARALRAEPLDDLGVLVRAQVEDDVVAILERVGVVEDEERGAVPVTDVLAGAAVEHDEPRAVLGPPDEVLDERAAPHAELEGFD